MPINYVPNDPDDTVMQASTVNALADRPASRVRFVARNLPAENVYPPGNAQFAAWQSRQVALATLDTFESLCGPLRGWRGEPARKEMDVLADAGEEINAYYTRDAIAFYHKIVGGQPIYSGASTDERDDPEAGIILRRVDRQNVPCPPASKMWASGSPTRRSCSS